MLLISINDHQVYAPVAGLKNIYFYFLSIRAMCFWQLVEEGKIEFKLIVRIIRFIFYLFLILKSRVLLVCIEYLDNVLMVSSAGEFSECFIFLFNEIFIIFLKKNMFCLIDLLKNYALNRNQLFLFYYPEKSFACVIALWDL